MAVLADDENVIARARVTAHRGGKRLDTENCYAFRFLDGKVADGQVFLSDPSRSKSSGPRRTESGRVLAAEIQRFVIEQRLGVVATVRPDGTPTSPRKARPPSGTNTT